MLKSVRSCRGERRALVRDALHELFPGLDEGLRAFQLQLFRKRVHVDPGLGEARDDLIYLPYWLFEIDELALILLNPDDPHAADQRLWLEQLGYRLRRAATFRLLSTNFTSAENA